MKLRALYVTLWKPCAGCGANHWRDRDRVWECRGCGSWRFKETRRKEIREWAE